MKRHCRGPLTKREGVVQKVNQYGDAGEQVVEISFITEGDVYRLIVHSKLPSAERFEHWVFDEVLPSIRKHGVYMSDSILNQVIQHPEVIYTLAQELVAEREQLEGKVNRVNNLISVHKKCYMTINTPGMDISDYEKQVQKKILSYREKLVVSHTRNN